MSTSTKGILGLVVAVATIIVIAGLSRGDETPPTAYVPSERAGGQRAGEQQFIDGIDVGGELERWYVGKLDPLSNSKRIFTNTSGKDVIAYYGDITISTGQVASSTYDVSIFASTTSAIPATQNFSALSEGKRALIQSDIIATSTTASTTSSVYASVIGKGRGAVLVPDGSTLWLYLQQNTTRCSIAGAVSGAACETATSSARGINPEYRVKVHQKPVTPYQ